MKWITLLLFFIACNNPQIKDSPKKTSPDSTLPDSTAATLVPPDSIVPPVPPSVVTPVTDTAPKVYSNKRFRDVVVTKAGGNKFNVKGKGQIFESRFAWIIEDGHNELATGFADTDAGAPAWGDFSFTVDAIKKNPSSTLHLVLFEYSANDGSRQHQLPILLY